MCAVCYKAKKTIQSFFFGDFSTQELVEIVGNCGRAEQFVIAKEGNRGISGKFGDLREFLKQVGGIATSNADIW